MAVTATGDHHRLDEKEVQFRKRLGSDHEASEGSSPEPSDTITERSSAKKGLLGKRQFHQVKQQFIDLLDVYEEGELGGIVFDVQFSSKGAHVHHREYVGESDKN